jgi:hypothetical protein
LVELPKFRKMEEKYKKSNKELLWGDSLYFNFYCWNISRSTVLWL